MAHPLDCHVSSILNISDWVVRDLL